MRNLRCNKSDKFNVGRLFDQTLIDNILKMCLQIKGKQFTIYSPQPCRHSQTIYSKLKQQKLNAKIFRGQYDQEDFYYQQEKSFVDFRWQKSLKKPYFKQNLEKSKDLWQRWAYFQSNILHTLVSKINDPTKNIKELNLKSNNNQKFKLTQKDMEIFSKVELPCLTEIVLQNNRIKDEGLAIISKNNYPQLKKIDLDDNAISINGLQHILNNNWGQKVKYNLYAVQSNEDEYYLNVGQVLPTMKKIIAAKNMDEVDYLIPVQKNKTLNAINLLLNTPLDSGNQEKVEKISFEILKKYRQKSDKDAYSLASVLIQLKEYLGDSLNFIETPNIKSSLTSKIIFTGLLNERVTFTKRLKKFKNFRFSDFRHNHKKIIQFQAEYMEYLRKNFGVDTTDMVVNKIIEGSIIVCASDSLQNAHVSNRSFFQNQADEVKFFFNNLLLTEDEFDKDGNFQFPKIQKAQIQVRGGFPYYQPVLGKRFGIKVMDLYDKGNNNWLMMNGNKEEWAIAFHGVNYPKQGNKMRSIMDGRVAGQMLLQGSRQKYQNSICLKNGSAVGKGIYTSPYFLDSLGYSKVSGKQKFHLLLQCRAKPASIKIVSQKADYWVINNRQQLRPYGIILFTGQDLKLLKSMDSQIQNIHKIIYKQQCFTPQTWKNIYKQQYEKFIKKK